jgi:hypothetical protein
LRLQTLSMIAVNIIWNELKRSHSVEKMEYITTLSSVDYIK